MINKNLWCQQVIPPSSGLIDYAVSLRPDYHRAVIDTITFYGWKNVIYIYDSHDGKYLFVTVMIVFEYNNTRVVFDLVVKI